jgi:predicted DNA-binding protein (UPF0251 family)
MVEVENHRLDASEAANHSATPAVQRFPPTFETPTRLPRISPNSFDTGTRRASNPGSGEPGEVPDNEVNADLGIPSFRLVRVQGLTLAEVAGLLDVSVKTVHRRLNAAVLALAEALTDLRLNAASTGESPGD